MQFSSFPRDIHFEAKVPIVVLASGRVIHRFFDTSPISPSGRYAALFRLPNETLPPKPAEAGEVVVVDLVSGQERVVATSRGWEIQVGANVQWGNADTDLFFNDVDVATWTPHAVQLDVFSGAIRRLEGTVFTVSPNGRQLASYNLAASRRIQVGYGVVLPDAHTPRNRGAVATDGLFVTDIVDGKSRMIVSIRDIVARAVPSLSIDRPDRLEFYCFQIRWNPAGTRLMSFLRWFDPADPSPGAKRLALITLKPDGTDIHVAVSATQYARGGHHPLWCPDGEHLTLNLNIRDKISELDLVQVRFDGADLRSLHPRGSGHPSMHPTLPFILTDAYPREPVTRQDGTAPLRLIDLRTKEETVLAHVPLTRSDAAQRTSEHRVDAHPVWDRNGRYIVFNGVRDDTRTVFAADMTTWLSAAL